ncbi:hypothetical protein Y1Q_0012468 [Alligator mississippiensis]|uniref:Uncharacterized protein n=1 Tax=Alligator mississippiensis TaxID=8496 RepID=A0A151M7R3_ALLMI|nr:hypothetical protein Y1Q_0012468 [Alligator mississippiensis]
MPTILLTRYFAHPHSDADEEHEEKKKHKAKYTFFIWFGLWDVPEYTCDFLRHQLPMQMLTVIFHPIFIIYLDIPPLWSLALERQENEIKR